MRLVYLTSGWVCGLFIAAHFDHLPYGLWLGLLPLAIYLIFVARHSRALWLAAALAALVAAGLRFSVVPKTSEVAAFNGAQVSIVGVVIEDPDVRDHQINLRIRAETIFDGASTFATSGDILASVPSTADVAYGDRVRVGGPLRIPAEYDTFSYSDFLARKGIFSIMRPATVEVIERGQGSPLLAGLLAFRAQLRVNISASLPEPMAGLLTGILLGDERGISPQLAADFSAVGASHIVAISGFNMAIVAGVVVGLMTRLKASQRAAAFAAIGVLVVYSALVGASASVVRAAFMCSLLLIAPLMNRQTFLPATVAFALLVMTLLDPLALWDVGFQLSFCAVMGLATLVPPLQKALDRLLLRALPTDYARTASSFLSDALIVTLAAQIATLPLMILYFQKVSVVSLLVNLLVLPAQPAILIIGGLAAILSLLLPAAAALLFSFALLLLGYTIAVVRFFADFPFAQAAVVLHPNLLAWITFIALGGFMAIATRPPAITRLARFLQQRPVRSAVLLSGTAIFALLAAMAFSVPDGRLHIRWLDNGHSNAILVQTPGGAHILFDGGRFPTRLLTSLGDFLPFYDREIELLVLSQPDDFDNSAVLNVLDRYSVKALLTNGQPNLSPVQSALRARLADVPQHAGTAGSHVIFSDGVVLEVLNPQRLPALEDSLGDAALVVRLTYGQRSFLLMSDASQDAQLAVLASAHPAADVLQLPDHGAARSLNRAFLDAVQPSLVVLQADASNSRGDPAPESLAMIGQTPLLRTDQAGPIHLVTDGDAVWYWPAG